MHGILLKGLKEFVVDSYDRRTWNQIRDEAPTERKVYLPIETYDDDELLVLVEAASEVTGESTDALLDAYGRSIATRLIETYGNVIDDEWSAAELVVKVETHVLSKLRDQNQKMSPPTLDVQQLDSNQLLITYGSYRRLCPVAKGILRGVGDYYGETFGVTERRCMHDGANACELILTV